MRASMRGSALAVWLALSLTTGCAGERTGEKAASSGLDTSFGSQGVVLTSFLGDAEQGYSIGYALAVQPDGKVIVAGTKAGDGAYSKSFALARYLLDGSLDSTFGNGGKVDTAFQSEGESRPPEAECRAVVIQGDGKIVAAGFLFLPFGFNYRFALARYNPDGTLDSGFGSGGRVITSFGSDAAQAFAVAIQADKKIVAAGSARGCCSGLPIAAGVFALVRYQPDGSLDDTFGTGGRVDTAVGSNDEGARGVLIQKDGKIVVAGSSSVVGVPGPSFALVRYLTDGSVDPSFGALGRVTTSIGSGGTRAQAVTIQADGKVVAVGSSWAVGHSAVLALARYDDDGRLDPSFGNDGRMTTDLRAGETSANAVAIQADGKIVAAGGSQAEGGGTTCVLARYRADGLLDTAFGRQGQMTVPFASTSSEDDCNGLAIQADGKILAAGESRPYPGPPGFALARCVP